MPYSLEITYLRFDVYKGTAYDGTASNELLFSALIRGVIVEKNPLFVEANEANEAGDQDWREWKFDDNIVSMRRHHLQKVADLDRDACRPLNASLRPSRDQSSKTRGLQTLSSTTLEARLLCVIPTESIESPRLHRLVLGSRRNRILQRRVPAITPGLAL